MQDHNVTLEGRIVTLQLQERIAYLERHLQAQKEQYAESIASLRERIKTLEERNRVLSKQNKSLRAEVHTLQTQLYWKPTHEANYKEFLWSQE